MNLQKTCRGGGGDRRRAAANLQKTCRGAGGEFTEDVQNGAAKLQKACGGGFTEDVQRGRTAKLQKACREREGGG